MQAKVCDSCGKIVDETKLGTIIGCSTTINGRDLTSGCMEDEDFCNIKCLMNRVEQILSELRKN